VLDLSYLHILLDVVIRYPWQSWVDSKVSEGLFWRLGKRLLPHLIVPECLVIQVKKIKNILRRSTLGKEVVGFLLLLENIFAVHKHIRERPLMMMPLEVMGLVFKTTLILLLWFIEDLHFEIDEFVVGDIQTFVGGDIMRKIVDNVQNDVLANCYVNPFLLRVNWTVVVSKCSDDSYYLSEVVINDERIKVIVFSKVVHMYLSLKDIWQ